MGRLTSEDLTEAERALLAAVVAGDWLDFTETGDTPAIRGEVIRRLLLDRFDWPEGTGPDPRGVRVRGAWLAGGLDLAEIETRLPLSLIDCRTDEPVQLTGSSLSTVDFSGLVGVRVVAQEVKIERSLTLRDARLGGGPYPTLHLGGARIGGVLNLSGAQLTNPNGSALQGSNLQVGGGVFLSQGFRAEGSSEFGVVRLSGAVLGTMLNMSGASIRSSDGPALVADYLRTGSNVLLNNDFHAEGTRDSGTVRLIGARIGGRLVCDGGRAVAAEGEIALNLAQVAITGDLALPADFAAGLLDLNGLVYGGKASGATLAEWLAMLATTTPRYTSQPYFQLAAAHTAAGLERDVRRIHIARQKDLLRRGELGFWGRAWHRLTGVTVGYGYRPGIALLWVIGTLLASVSLTLVAGAAGLTRRGGQGPCSVVEQVGLALSAAAPLVKVDTQRCVLDTAAGPGQAVLAAGWVLQTLTWAFLTLFVAGFTGLVRKSSS